MNNVYNKIHDFIDKCRISESSMLPTFINYLIYRMSGKNILANNKVIIKGLQNIQTNGRLEVGMTYVGFMHKYDTTYLNINGSLIFQTSYSIGKGCRFDIGKDAVARFGSGYVNPNVTFIIMHGITIGDESVISWGCEFLDEDFHKITYNQKKNKDPKIELGRHVWIGSNVIVLKGSRIPDGCVVASGSVVSTAFEKQNCLIAGNPARVIKENIEWE